VILLATFIAACGEGKEELLDAPLAASLTPNVTGTWSAVLSGDGFLTSDTTFTAAVSATAEFRLTQSDTIVSGEYAVQGTISTLDPDGAAFSFPLTATGLVDGEIAMTADAGDPPMPMVAAWRLTATLASFSGGADASFTADVTPYPGAVPTEAFPPEFFISGIRFKVGGLVHESRTYQFKVTGSAVRVP
jgi:hypothetical protein